jgi:hypothetical protein
MWIDRRRQIQPIEMSVFKTPKRREEEISNPQCEGVNGLEPPRTEDHKYHVARSLVRRVKPRFHYCST